MERTTVEELLARARSTLERLEPEQVLAAQAAGAIVVDTRDTADREREGVIPGSVHLPRTVLEWRLDPASTWRDAHASANLDRVVVVVCNDGFSSSLAAATLQELGYARATDLVGGFRAWKARGLPVEPA